MKNRKKLKILPEIQVNIKYSVTEKGKSKVIILKKLIMRI